eukprot:TRINITY_DN3139_c0_g2_i3.p1 TRINITY_DN3139_c0_g2~~TRINITY_DN3139_c0_g2_i3.p1  ORF type:complete len:107 (-),score=31.19 TRINITY_DN3139_c0_g2_i3:360-680(-)
MANIPEERADVRLIFPGILSMGCYDMKHVPTVDQVTWKVFADVCFVYGEKGSTEIDGNLMEFKDDSDGEVWRLWTTTWRFQIDEQDSDWRLVDILEVNHQFEEPEF